MKTLLEEIEIKKVELAYLLFLEHEDRFPNKDKLAALEIQKRFIKKLEE